MRHGLLIASAMGALMLGGIATAQPPGAPPAGGAAPPSRPPPVQGVTLLPGGRVQFKLRAPEAKSVKVLIDSVRQAAVMTKDESGVWSYVSDPLPPMVYRYGFEVDGVPVLDQTNIDYATDQSGARALFEIKSPSTQFIDYQDVPHGAVSRLDYRAKALGGMLRTLHVYTPPGYEKGSQSYPVLYLLHGGGDDDTSWTDVGHANYILDNLIAAGKAKPMIVVMPAGHIMALPGETAPPGANPAPGAPLASPLGSDFYSRDVVEDVIPMIEARYRVKRGPANTAIAGLSMGGGQTAVLAYSHPELFGYVGIFSANTNETIRKSLVGDLKGNLAIAKRNFRLVYLAAGSQDFALAGYTAQLPFYKEHGFNTVTSVLPGKMHAWDTWQLNLNDYAPRIFK